MSYPFTRFGAALALALAASGGQAATITVTTNSEGTGGPDCTLRDAITAANSDLATGGCPQGVGPDIVVLPTGAVFTFTAPNDIDPFAGGGALPAITADLTIEGAGARIERSAGPCTIDNVAGAGEFRIMRLSAAVPLTSGVTIRDLTLRNGCGDSMFSASGGAILSQNVPLTLERVTMINNVSTIGGAVSSAVLTVRGAYFAGNLATLQGGAIGTSGAPIPGGGPAIDIEGATFSANNGGQNGGGVFMAGAPFAAATTVRIRNSTFSGNVATLGGTAIHANDALRVELSHVTIANNTGSTNAALMGTTFPFPGPPPAVPTFVLRSVWLSENTGGGCGPTGPLSAAFTFEGVNLSTDGTCSGATSAPTGELQALDDYGGYAPTRRPNAGSAGIDAASSCTLVGGAAIAVDQRGFTRPRAGDNSGTAECDIGAVELQAGAPPQLTVPASATTLSDAPLLFGTSFGNAITLADADNGSSPLSLQLSVSQGTLSLATTTGLTFDIGDGTADTTMRFQGTLTAIAAALDGLAYTPFLGYTGPDTLALTANDLGSVGETGAQTANASVPITVAVRAAIATAAPASLAFGSRNVDAGPSAAQVVVLSNTGNIPLENIVFKLVPADYALVHDCPAALAPGEDCTLSITFDPTTTGSRLGVLAVISNGATSPNGIVLTGSGFSLVDAVFSNGFE